jgi:catechol 2,3-dioxygenase-like lactoylglutathione lyase family enzyme
MTIRRIVPNLQAEEPGAGAAFYRDVLGLDPVMDLGWIVTYGDGTERQISAISADASAPVVPDVSIEVDDVDEAYEAACSTGAEIVHPLTDEPWGVRRFFVRAPDGNVINIVSHRDE